MKKLCSWCNQEFEIEKPSEIAVSDECVHDEFMHDGFSALCESCKNKWHVQNGVTLVELINTIEVPVISVNAEGIVELANDQAVRLFDKNVQRIRGSRGGDVFDCVNARLPGGCGYTIHCSGCTIRNTVMRTFKTGETCFRKPASLQVSRKGVSQEINFFITTIKYNQYVVLKIEETAS
jgi:hypothetical protein